MNIIILNSDIERITPNGHFAIKGVKLPDGRYMLPDRVMTDKHLTDFVGDVQAVKEADSEILDLPDIGQECVKDVIYKLPSDLVDENLSDLVVCVQTHNRTIYNPKETPALFSFFRENSDELGWIQNEWVELGWKRMYNGVQYEVIQPHQTLIGYEPDKTPALWKKVPSSTEYEVFVHPTGAHDVYMKGDIVWYPEKDTTLYRSKIDNNSWSPDEYGAGWEIYTP